MPEDTLTLQSANGVSFTAQIIRPGDPYGRNQQLINNKETMIEFYDARYPFDSDKTGNVKLGQFVSRYYLKTLLSPNHGPSRGLNMHNGVPEWTIDPETFKTFMGWATS